MSTIKSNQSEVEIARLVQVLAQVPENAKLMTIIKYMELSYLPSDYCVKAVVTEIMKSLSLADMLKLKAQYSNWIKEHHITYAAVLAGRMDMLIYYDAYVEKQTLVTPVIKSGNCEMFTKVFTDAMNLFESIVMGGGSIPKEKINIKKHIWSWIDAVVASGNWQALSVILPRVKSIIAGADVGRITRFFRKTPADALTKIAAVLIDNNIDLTVTPNNYLHMACVHGISDVINQYASSLSTVNPHNIGMSVNRELFDRYLNLLDPAVDAVILPGGIVLQLSSNIITGALESPYQEGMIDFLKYVLERFVIAPNAIKTTIYESISYPNMLALIQMGVEVVIDIKLSDLDERLAYLIQNGVNLDTIINIISNSHEIVLGDTFVRVLLEKDKNILVLILSYLTNCPNVLLEITSATALTILNKCVMIKPIILTLIDTKCLSIRDDLWCQRCSGGVFSSVDKCRFDALVNKSYEKYIVNILELWQKHNIFIETEGFIWVALCCDFNHFGVNKTAIISLIKELAKVNPDILQCEPHSKIEFIFQTRDYRYQSMLHNADIEILTLIMQHSPHINYKFALKLAVENPGAFRNVFNLIPTAWYRDMFIVGGCLLRTQSFTVIFKCISAKGCLPSVDIIQRAITLFASHGKDDTIKMIIEWGRGKIKVNYQDIALLAMRDRSDSLQSLLKAINDKNNIALSIAYIIGAFRRKPETILKLSASGVKYQKLSIQNILSQKINEDEYYEADIENKIKAYNRQITDIAQKTKLYESLHGSVLTTIQYKSKQFKTL